VHLYVLYMFVKPLWHTTRHEELNNKNRLE